MPFLDDFKLVQTSVNCLFVSAGVCERKRALRCFWSFPWEIQSLSLGPGFSVLRYESDGLCGINPCVIKRLSLHSALSCPAHHRQGHIFITQMSLSKRVDRCLSKRWSRAQIREKQTLKKT